MNIPERIDLPIRIEANGTIRVGNTRVTLDVVLNEYLNGSSPDEIARNFEALKLSDVHFVIGYYLDNQAELNDYLQKREAEADQLRQQIESLPSYKPLTVEMLEARLNARRKQE